MAIDALSFSWCNASRQSAAGVPVPRDPAPLIACCGQAGFTSVVWDISERKRTEQVLRESEERYRELFENANDIVFTHDLAGRFTSVNRAGERIIGYSREETLRMNIADMLTPESLLLARQMIQQKLDDSLPTRYELEVIAKSGEPVVLEVSTRLVLRDGQPGGVQGIARDISDRKRAEAALAHQALYDMLTGLPNRVLFRDRVQQSLLAAQRDSVSVALLMMDLDRFKEVNDTLGHHYGDVLLPQVGARLTETLRDSDTVARLGGDEFGILLRGSDERAPVQTAQKVLRALTRPFELDGQTLDIGASIGIALYPLHGADDAALMRQADVAMYVAKRARAGYAVYAPSLDENSSDRLAMSVELRRAIGRNQLLLEYQPVVELRTGVCRQVEALVRWNHPEYGFVPPDDFIPLAEHTGVIRELGFWVLRCALQQVRRWHENGIDVCVAVNLSARGLHEAQFAGTIGRLIRASAVAPTALKLEITESVVMADPARSMATLTRLHDIGIRIAIDDFGTGHSSLAYLQRLPVDEIKIDRSFTAGITTNRDDAFIVRSIIELGHNRGLQIVAEGVEDRETLDALSDLGCDLAQGYYLSHPISPEDVGDWLRLRATA